jgi:hypothetical protein
MSEEYECALTGITSPGGVYTDTDDLQDIPAGWVEVRFSRRIPNPAFLALNGAKDALIRGLSMQVGENPSPQQVALIQVQVEANFYAILKDTQPYLTEVEVVHIAPPESSEALMEGLNEVREGLGLEAYDSEDDEEAEQEEEKQDEHQEEKGE